MLKIMKAKGAVFGNPILRPVLRTEARKLIGDTEIEAGVQDPYWTPSAGWKPGDNPTKDLVCVREIETQERDGQYQKVRILCDVIST
ncbi:hypothetical protein L484_002166 [Morus notabilis]|uniref:Uncharacterized protein n=1 Tax=Morus notabilis TaxID=981085 RepID=W9S2T8_9ROSA|nr:hypothetical protein L484_002166 [Morus notabilis]